MRLFSHFFASLVLVLLVGVFAQPVEAQSKDDTQNLITQILDMVSTLEEELATLPECVDWDGDGWGWDGEKGCLMSAVLAERDEKNRLITSLHLQIDQLLSLQSDIDYEFYIQQVSNNLLSEFRDQPLLKAEFTAPENEPAYINRLILDVEKSRFSFNDVSAANVFDGVSVWFDGKKIREYTADALQLGSSTLTVDLFDSNDYGYGIKVDSGETIEVELALSIKPEAELSHWVIGVNDLQVWTSSTGDRFLDINYKHSFSVNKLMFEQLITESTISEENDELFGEVNMMFDVTAHGEDLYIPSGLYNGLLYELVNANGDIEEHELSGENYDSTADEINGHYVIGEGETEEFQFPITIVPPQAGGYFIRLKEIPYTDFIGKDYASSYLNFTSHVIAFGQSVQEETTECVDWDGDGWGWDGEKGCLVAEYENDDSEEVDQEEVTEEEQQTTECVDWDGDGWGWDGEKGCQVDVQEDDITASFDDGEETTECVDWDGDGWGWDGEKGCLVIDSL